jgi:hypothetical protein
MSNEVSIPERQSLDRYLPQSVKDLAWMASEVAKSGIYQNGNRALSGSECFVLMMKGAELGLTPMQSLNEISLIKGKPFVSKDVLTARILRSPRCEAWDPSDMDAKHCTIIFKIRGDDLPSGLTTNIDDIPQRYFTPSRSGEPSNWTLIPEDMLFGWTVRRIARRWFPEALLDIGDGRPEPIDETRVIDVAKVERETGFRDEVCPNCGMRTMLLQAASTGGAFLACNNCNKTMPPPQEVRDAVRGTPEHLTLAGVSEPVLEPGERPATPTEIERWGADMHHFGPVDASDSAVQSESERDTLDGEDVVAVQASAESAPIPEPARDNQAMRNAIYEHWIRPRPMAIKIEMRGLLESFGWNDGSTLGDWLLDQPDDKLAAIGDALAAYA